MRSDMMLVTSVCTIGQLSEREFQNLRTFYPRFDGPLATRCASIQPAPRDKGKRPPFGRLYSTEQYLNSRSNQEHGLWTLARLLVDTSRCVSPPLAAEPMRKKIRGRLFHEAAKVLDSQPWFRRFNFQVTQCAQNGW